MESGKAINGIRRVLLIDLDNCPQELLLLSDIADQYEMIVACHGSKEPRVPLGLVSVIGDLIAQGRIEVVAMPSGKNSADFGLSFWAGRLSVTLPPEVEFHIASQDKDLDHAVFALKHVGRLARRISGSRDSGVTPTSGNVSLGDTKRVSVTDVEVLCQRLLGIRQHFPRNRQALNNLFKGTSLKHQSLLRALTIIEKEAIITYTDKGRVECDFQRLKAYPKVFSAKLSPAPPYTHIGNIPGTDLRHVSSDASNDEQRDHVHSEPLIPIPMSIGESLTVVPAVRSAATSDHASAARQLQLEFSDDEDSPEPSLQAKA